MNNFKNLNKEKIANFEKIGSPLVEKKIKGNLNFFQFIGNLIELFIPKQAQMYGKMLEDDKKYSNPGASNDINLQHQNKYPS